jgi:hypothetical protein
MAKLEQAQRTNPSMTQSKFIRWCISQALSEETLAMSPEDAAELLNEIRLLRRALSNIGGNLNQIAHYFNTHSYLIESDLSHQHESLRDEFKTVIDTLRKVESKIQKRTL